MALSQQVEIFHSQQIESLSAFSPGTRVVIALPKNELLSQVDLMQRIQKMGHTPIPTIPARRVKSEQELGSFLKSMQDLSLSDIVLVGGNDTGFNVFQDAMGLLLYLSAKKPSLHRVYMPGHPEQLRVTSTADVMRTLREKVRVIKSAGWEPILISQACLSANAYVTWIDMLVQEQIEIPIFTGLIPSCDKETLMKRLELCSLLRNVSFGATYGVCDTLKDSYDPLALVTALKPHIDSGKIIGLHWYGFGDIAQVITDMGRID